MFKFLTSAAALAFSFTLSAGDLGYPMSLDDIELNSRGAFVECRLQNKSTLYANLDMVIYNSEILSKYEAPKAFMSSSAENLLYSSHQYQVLVSKQFCGREGIQSVTITNKITGEKIQTACVAKSKCD